MTKIAIVAALPGEVKPLVRGWRTEKRNGVNLWFETRGKQDRVVAFAGIGIAAATRALAEIERDGAADVIISIGWAGALRTGLPTGTAFRASRVIDAGSGEIFPCANTTTLSSGTSSLPHGTNDQPEARPASSATLTCITLAHFANPEDKQRLANKFAADLVDMEAAALARIAARRGVPFHCLKGISDGPGDHLPDFTRFIDAGGQLQLGRFAGFAMTHPSYMPALIRLGRKTKKAAEDLRVSLLAILENVATATP